MVSIDIFSFVLCQIERLILWRLVTVRRITNVKPTLWNGRGVLKYETSPKWAIVKRNGRTFETRGVIRYYMQNIFLPRFVEVSLGSFSTHGDISVSF